MKEIIDRLKETAAEAVKAFEAWDKKRSDGTLTEAAQEAAHELRKVTSRLEIELVHAERESFSAAPIPLPQHRAAGKPQVRED